MIALAIKIANCNYERLLEKKGHYIPGEYTKKKYGRKPYYRPQPMELDATFRHSELSSSEKERRSKERSCFTCRKPGHQARNCKQKTGNKT